MRRVGVLLQARLGSTRYPNKVLAKLAGDWRVLDECCRRLSGIPADVHTVVTDLRSLAALTPVVQDAHWEIFAGDPVDVMKRYIDAGRYYQLDVIVRACGDNPLVDVRVANWALGIHLDGDAVATRVLGGDLGTAVEVVNLGALIDAYDGADASDREHVMSAIWRGAEVRVLHTDPVYGESVTIDTMADLERVRRIYAGR